MSADMAIIDDLMRKVEGDISSAIMRTATLVDAPNMVPIAHCATMRSLMITAMMFDAAAHVSKEETPTHAAIALAAYLALNTVLETEHPWNDALAKVKERWPDAKVPQVDIVDRRTAKKAA